VLQRVLQLKTSYASSPPYTSSLPYSGLRRCIGWHILYVSFWKRATNYGALLQKLTYKLKASYASLQPYSGFLLESLLVTWWRRVIAWLIYMGYFSQKSPIISGSYAKRDLQVILRIFVSLLPVCSTGYGVATISRLLKIIGFFCRISSLS